MDHISDMLSRIRAASKSRKKIVTVTATRSCKLILDRFYQDGFIYGYAHASPFLIRVFLKYDQFGSGLLKNVKKGSTGGRRFYFSYKQLVRLFRHTSYYTLVSTSRGLRTLKDLKFLNDFVGGEIIVTLKS